MFDKKEIFEIRVSVFGFRTTEYRILKLKWNTTLGLELQGNFPNQWGTNPAAPPKFAASQPPTLPSLPDCHGSFQCDEYHYPFDLKYINPVRFQQSRGRPLICVHPVVSSLYSSLYCGCLTTGVRVSKRLILLFAATYRASRTRLFRISSTRVTVSG